MRAGVTFEVGRGLWLDAASEWRSGNDGHELFLQLAQQI
jgi:hypothetical protein